MQKLKRFLLILLLVIYATDSHAQSADSLHVFPNPFSSTATIHFEIAQADTVTLRVFTMSGKNIITYFETTSLPSGSYNINLLGDTLADGVYLVRLDMGATKSLTQKVQKKSTVAGTEATHQSNDILLFPNPTNDLLSIPIEGEKTVMITDLNGRIIQKLITEQKEISLLELEAGAYIINILNKQNELITSQKILKNN